MKINKNTMKAEFDAFIICLSFDKRLRLPCLMEGGRGTQNKYKNGEINFSDDDFSRTAARFIL